MKMRGKDNWKVGRRYTRMDTDFPLRPGGVLQSRRGGRFGSRDLMRSDAVGLGIRDIGSGMCADRCLLALAPAAHCPRLAVLELRR